MYVIRSSSRMHVMNHGNPVALCDRQHAGKEIVTRPKSEYFANDPESHDLLPCTLRSHRVAGLGGMSHRAACGWSHVHVDSGPVRSCGPVPFAVTGIVKQRNGAPVPGRSKYRRTLQD